MGAAEAAGAAAVAEREGTIGDLEAEILELQEALAAAQAGGEAEVMELREKVAQAEAATVAEKESGVAAGKAAKTALEEEAKAKHSAEKENEKVATHAKRPHQYRNRTTRAGSGFSSKKDCFAPTTT